MAVMEAARAILDQKFSQCDACQASLGDIKFGRPVYCIPCIEEMGRLGIGTTQYRKYRLKEALSKK